MNLPELSELGLVSVLGMTRLGWPYRMPYTWWYMCIACRPIVFIVSFTRLATKLLYSCCSPSLFHSQIGLSFLYVYSFYMFMSYIKAIYNCATIEREREIERETEPREQSLLWLMVCDTLWSSDGKYLRNYTHIFEIRKSPRHIFTISLQIY